MCLFVVKEFHFNRFSISISIQYVSYKYDNGANPISAKREESEKSRRIQTDKIPNGMELNVIEANFRLVNDDDNIQKNFDCN